MTKKEEEKYSASDNAQTPLLGKYRKGESLDELKGTDKMQGIFQ